MTTFIILRASKNYQNLDFWSENKPSGNPVTQLRSGDGGSLILLSFVFGAFPRFCIHSSVCLQGCQILRGTMYQNYDNIPHDHKIYQHVIKYTKWLENGPNGHPYNSIFHCKALRNLPKLGFLVWKYTYHLATPFVCSLLPFAGIRDALKTLFIIAGSDLLN
jgi:hypothetical protein